MIDDERALLGAIILDARWLDTVIGVVRPDDFADGRLATIYEGILAMQRAGTPIDALTVGSMLAKWDLRGIDVADLHQWTSEVPFAGHASQYAETVHDAALRRTMQMIAERLDRDARSLEPAVAIQRAQAGLDGLSRESARDLSSRPLAALLEDDGRPDYDWVITGLLERGDRVMLTGGEGGGKTTMLRQLAITAGSGLNPFTWMPIPPVRVLVIDAENTERQWRRQVRGMIAKGTTMGSDPGQRVRLANTARLDLTKPSDLLAIHRLVDQHDPALVVIGPLYRLVPRAINSDDDAVPLLAALDTLRDRGLALVIEAHAGHAIGYGGERELRPRGSSALLGWPEFGLGLRRDREDMNGWSLVRWRGDRDSRMWPSRLRRGGEWPWTPTRFPQEAS